jgi:uncharacterized protein with PQ loop repeat
MEKIIFGTIASGISFLYKVPQMYELYKVKKTDGLSLSSLLLQLVSYVFYILHGYFVRDYTILIGMALPVLQNIIIIAMYFKYKV